MKLRNQLVLLFGGLFCGYLMLDVAQFPWAYPLPGVGSLPGQWRGELQQPGGLPATLELDLEPRSGSHRGPSKWLRIEARLCDSNGVRHYTGRAEPRGWLGRHFQASIHTDEASEGRRLSLDVNWDGGDVLQAAVDLHDDGRVARTSEQGTMQSVPPSAVVRLDRMADDGGSGRCSGAAASRR